MLIMSKNGNFCQLLNLTSELSQNRVRLELDSKRFSEHRSFLRPNYDFKLICDDGKVSKRFLILLIVDSTVTPNVGVSPSMI